MTPDPYDLPDLTDSDYERHMAEEFDEFAGFLAGEFAIGDDDILGLFGL